MPLNNDIFVNIVGGGIGRQAAGKDHYTGLIFQAATKPAGYGAADIKRIYSLAEAETLGITVALFPVAHYQISEYFRVLAKFNFSAFIDAGFYNIATGTFDGTEIKTMQDNTGGELRQIGVFLEDPFATTFITGAGTVATTLETEGNPVSVYLAADVADLTALTDLRLLDEKYVSLIASQDGAGVGAALSVSEGYSIGAIGAQLAATAFAAVHERIGWVDKFDVSGVTELQTLALIDGRLLSAVTDTEIDLLNTEGLTLIIKRRITGSYFYTDSVTASAGTSDFTEQRFNRTISKAKRLILEKLAPLQNAPIFVDPTTGKITEQTIGVFDSAAREALNVMAVNQEISVEPATGRIPQNSITINPDQDVLTTNKIVITARIVPIGAAGVIEVDLSFATQLS